jgi:hypothetical protein
VLSHARVDDGGRAARLLMLDEFAALGHLSMVERMFAVTHDYEGGLLFYARQTADRAVDSFIKQNRAFHAWASEGRDAGRNARDRVHEETNDRRCEKQCAATGGEKFVPRRGHSR